MTLSKIHHNIGVCVEAINELSVRIDMIREHLMEQEDRKQQEADLEDLVRQGIVERKIVNGQDWYRLTKVGVGIAKALKAKENGQ